ncbi:unnamed protein product [Rhodiola kirilowii]
MLFSSFVAFWLPPNAPILRSEASQDKAALHFLDMQTREH